MQMNDNSGKFPYPNYANFHIKIKDEQDKQKLQNNLHKLYKWADTNNIKFNANKFELLRNGKEREIKSATTFKSCED